MGEIEEARSTRPVKPPTTPTDAFAVLGTQMRERTRQRTPITLFAWPRWNRRKIPGVLFHRIFDIRMRLEKRSELGVLAEIP